MLRAAGVVVLAMLAGAAPANAGPPNVTISASATAGAAPLTVTFEASGDAASYSWQLGNGETAEGPTASATYGPGLWTVTVTATAADGSTSQASVTVRSEAVTLLPVAERRYGKPAVFEGRVVPAFAGEPVALYVRGLEVAAALADADGAFRLRLPRVRTPGPYEARTPVAASAPVALRLHPLLRATFVGARAVGGRLALAARGLPCRGGHDLDPRLPRRRPHAQGPGRRCGQARRGHRPHRAATGRSFASSPRKDGSARCTSRAPTSSVRATGLARATYTATVSCSGPTAASATSSSPC